MSENGKQKHTLRGHLRSLAVALIFGLGAYAVINVMMYLSHSIGSRL